MQAELNGHAAGIILIFVPTPFDVGLMVSTRSLEREGDGFFLPPSYSLVTMGGLKARYIG